MAQLTEQKVRSIVREELVELNTRVGNLEGRFDRIEVSHEGLRDQFAEMMESQTRIEIMFEQQQETLRAMAENHGLWSRRDNDIAKLQGKTNRLDDDVSALKSWYKRNYDA